MPGLEEACDIRLFKIKETTSTKNKDGALIDIKWDETPIFFRYGKNRHYRLNKNNGYISTIR